MNADAPMTMDSTARSQMDSTARSQMDTATQTWCAIHTHARAEDKAAHHLRRQGFTVFLPKYLKQRKHARRIDWVKAPLFSRYLFVAVDPMVTPWRAILSTVGVADMIRFGDRPAEVPSAIIDEIRARQDERGLVTQHTGGTLTKGDRVQIIAGPFNELDGLFECTDDDKRTTILLSLMGRQVRVRVPTEAVYAAA